MAIEVFNRYEHKYFMQTKTYEKVLKVTDQHMVLDKYNQGHRAYTIANVYFDTDDDYLIRHSLEKPKYKEKLRLRAYGVPDADTKVFLEIKKKFDGVVNKRRTTLTLKEAYFFSENAHKTLNIMRKYALAVHKQYISAAKKKTPIKSSMLACLLDFNKLLFLLQNL